MADYTAFSAWRGMASERGISFAPAGKPDEAAQAIARALDDAQAKRAAGATPRSYLGASIIATPCNRALSYRYTNTPPDPGRAVTGRAQRIFDIGHASEELMAQWLAEAGFEISRADQETGQQYRFTAIGGRISGAVDGIVRSGPLGRWPAVWEAKSLKNSRWKKVQEEGLKQSEPIYYGQVQVYQAAMRLTENPALFTALNKDTAEIYVELVPYDEDHAGWLLERAVTITSRADPEQEERLGRTADDFVCRWCDWRERCWRSKKAPFLPKSLMPTP